jgi:hypothetical protein
VNQTADVEWRQRWAPRVSWGIGRVIPPEFEFLADGSVDWSVPKSHFEFGENAMAHIIADYTSQSIITSQYKSFAKIPARFGDPHRTIELALSGPDSEERFAALRSAAEVSAGLSQRIVIAAARSVGQGFEPADSVSKIASLALTVSGPLRATLVAEAESIYASLGGAAPSVQLAAASPPGARRLELLGRHLGYVRNAVESSISPGSPPPRRPLEVLVAEACARSLLSVAPYCDPTAAEELVTLASNLVRPLTDTVLSNPHERMSLLRVVLPALRAPFRHNIGRVVLRTQERHGTPLDQSVTRSDLEAWAWAIAGLSCDRARAIGAQVEHAAERTDSSSDRAQVLCALGQALAFAGDVAGAERVGARLAASDSNSGYLAAEVYRVCSHVASPTVRPRLLAQVERCLDDVSNVDRWLVVSRSLCGDRVPARRMFV